MTGWLLRPNPLWSIQDNIRSHPAAQGCCVSYGISRLNLLWLTSGWKSSFWICGHRDPVCVKHLCLHCIPFSRTASPNFPMAKMEHLMLHSPGSRSFSAVLGRTAGTCEGQYWEKDREREQKRLWGWNLCANPCFQSTQGMDVYTFRKPELLSRN